MRLKEEPLQGHLTEEQRTFLNQIYIAMYSTIYHYAIVAVQNEPLAQEIAQIVFTKACNDPESIMASPRPCIGMIISMWSILTYSIRRK